MDFDGALDAGIINWMKRAEGRPGNHCELCDLVIKASEKSPDTPLDSSVCVYCPVYIVLGEWCMESIPALTKYYWERRNTNESPNKERMERYALEVAEVLNEVKIAYGNKCVKSVDNEGGLSVV